MTFCPETPNSPPICADDPALSLSSIKRYSRCLTGLSWLCKALKGTYAFPSAAERHSVPGGQQVVAPEVALRSRGEAKSF